MNFKESQLCLKQIKIEKTLGETVALCGACVAFALEHHWFDLLLSSTPSQSPQAHLLASISWQALVSLRISCAEAPLPETCHGDEHAHRHFRKMECQDLTVFLGNMCKTKDGFSEG